MFCKLILLSTWCPFNHVATDTLDHSLSLLYNIPFVHVLLFTHPPLLSCLEYFQHFTILNSGAVNIHGYLLVYYGFSRKTDHRTCVSSTSQDRANCFPKILYQYYNPTSSFMRDSIALKILTHSENRYLSVLSSNFCFIFILYYIILFNWAGLILVWYEMGTWMNFLNKLLIFPSSFTDKASTFLLPFNLFSFFLLILT